MTSGWAGVLVYTLGFYKNKGLGWAKTIRVSKTPKFYRAILLVAYPTLNPGDAPDSDCPYHIDIYIKMLIYVDSVMSCSGYDEEGLEKIAAKMPL